VTTRSRCGYIYKLHSVRFPPLLTTVEEHWVMLLTGRTSKNHSVRFIMRKDKYPMLTNQLLSKLKFISGLVVAKKTRALTHTYSIMQLDYTSKSRSLGYDCLFQYSGIRTTVHVVISGTENLFSSCYCYSSKPRERAGDKRQRTSIFHTNSRSKS